MSDRPYILMVDDDPDILEATVTVLESMPYRVGTARDGRRCLELIEQEMPDLLILDLMMPNIDGFEVVRRLRDDPRYGGLSIMILSSVSQDASLRRYELETGHGLDVQDYVEKPVPPAQLLARVDGLLQRPYILVVDDDPDILEAITTVLRSEPYRVATARDGQQCMSLLKKKVPALLILDLLMPRVDGFAVLHEMRGQPQLADTPIVITTSVAEDPARRRYELEVGMEMRIDAYLEKPISPPELLRCVRVLLGEEQ
jgi:CheY-like chemotaxis protein